MIDFHNHLIPGVDDGAATLEESRAALGALATDGVTTVVTTSHLDGTVTNDPEWLAESLGRIDAAWTELKDLAAAEFPGLRLERGLEVMLNTPEPDLSDPRLRLAGTSFVLVEFPYMSVPPRSAETIFNLKLRGWNPVIAHPERYAGLDEKLEIVGEWRRVGGFLQVNAGSLLGRYGDGPKRLAWRLLARGWVDYISSDYHARGRCRIAEARARLEEKGGAEQAALLFSGNAARLLDDAPPEPVAPLRVPRRSWWSRLLRRPS